MLHILWNTNVHYRVHNRRSPLPILIQINPIHVFPFHMLKIHLPLTSSSGVFVQLPPPKPVCISLLPHTCHLPSPPRSHLRDRLNNVYSKQTMKLLILQSSVTSSTWAQVSSSVPNVAQAYASYE